MAEIVNLGILYLNGQPKDPGVEMHRRGLFIWEY